MNSKRSVRKEKLFRAIALILLLILLLFLHILGPSYFAPDSIFVKSFLVDILLPCYLFLLLTLNLYSLPPRLIKHKKKIKILFFLGVFLIGCTVEILQYFDFPVLGSTYDILDYVMYLLGTLLGVALDAFILRISQKD